MTQDRIHASRQGLKVGPGYLFFGARFSKEYLYREEFEQYQTTPQVSAEMIHNIYLNTEDFHLKTIIDLGCGNGTLGIAAALCGAE